MKQKSKQYWRQIRWLLLIIIIIAIWWPATVWIHQRVHNEHQPVKSNMQPVILVPGSSATENRFDTLIDKLNDDGQRHSLLKLVVKTNDAITYKGKIYNNDNQPYIVIAFQDNHDGYDNIKKQANWLSLALDALMKKYHFNHFNAIGHSNGGLIWTYFLENYFDPHHMTIDKLMTIGAPFNLNESSSTKRTPMLQNFIQNNNKLPKNLDVYTIVGAETYNTDGLVPWESAVQARYVFQGKVKHFTEITVTGANAEHSDLPQNTEIVQSIEQSMLIQDDNNNTAHNQEQRIPQKEYDKIIDDKTSSK